MDKRVYIVIFGAILLELAHGDLQEGDACNIPSTNRGICIKVQNCSVAYNILSNRLTPEGRRFLLSIHCGFAGNTPLVCCPQQTTRQVDPEPEIPTGEATSYQFLVPPECGISNATFPRIVGGVPAKLGEFPWMVALGYRNQKNPNQPKWLCGGSLITHKHVLTAAHCVYSRQDLYLARVGELDLYDDFEGASPIDIAIANAKIHENYSSTKFINDIAVLTLAKSTENLVNVLPICLPWIPEKRSKSYEGSNPFVAGWGALYFKGPSSSTLQYTTLPVVSNSKCEQAFANKSIIDERIICAGRLEGGRDACRGDSGGPLMHGANSPRDTKIRLYIIGVVSYGFRCAEAGYPGVYTRVTHFLDWIGENVK